MATLTNIILFVIIFSFVVFLGFTINAPAINGTELAQDSNASLIQVGSTMNSTMILLNETTVNPSVLTIFPNAFNIFFNVFKAIGQIVGLPLVIIVDLGKIGWPPQLTLLFTVLLTSLIIITLVNWYKGATA